MHAIDTNPSGSPPGGPTGGPTGPPRPFGRHLAGGIFPNLTNIAKPPAFSYSFRNAEMNVRFFGGGQEGEEKEENSESDEEEGEQSSKCVSAFKDFTSAVFPNTYPLIWLALPFAVCAVLSAASFGNNTDTEEGGLVVFTRENQFNASTSDPDTQTTFVKHMSTRDLTFQGVVVLIFISLINTAAWLGCMLARAIFLTIIVNIGLYQKQSVSSLLTTVDPELMYFLWSVGMYIFWQRNVRPGKMFCVKDIDATKSTIQLYDTSLFGQSLFVLPSIAKCQSVLSLLIILLAARRLVQSIMIFYFELGFMASMNGQVVKYLTKYAALRKLNTKWAAYHLCKDTLSQASCDGTSQEDDEGGGGLRSAELKRGRSMVSVTSRTSRFSRHPSLRVPTRALPSLVLDKPELPPPPCSAKVGKANISRCKHFGGRFVDRTVRINYFRFRFQENKNIQSRELRGQGLPSQLTRSSIERCKQSRIHHWLLLQYVAVFPPAVFLQGQRIEVDSKARAREVSDRLFYALAKDASELAAEQQPFRDSPSNMRPKGTPFLNDFHHTNKQQQHSEQERTVTWLGSPELQKVVTIDPTEEVCRTGAAAAAAGANAAATSATVATSMATPEGTPNSAEVSAPIPNNSTASTDPAGEGDCNTRLNSSCPPSVSLQASLQGNSSYEGEGLCPQSEASASVSEAASVCSTHKDGQRSAGKRIAEILGATTAPASAAPAAASGSSSSSIIRAGRQNLVPEATEKDEGPQRDKEDHNAEGSDRVACGGAARRGNTQHISTLTSFNIAIRAPSLDKEQNEHKQGPKFAPDTQQGVSVPVESGGFAAVSTGPRAHPTSKQRTQQPQAASAYASASVGARAREKGCGMDKKDEEGVEMTAASATSQPPLQIAAHRVSSTTHDESLSVAKELWRTSCPSVPPYQRDPSLESGPSFTYASDNDMVKEAIRREERKPKSGDSKEEVPHDERQKMTSELLGAVNTANSSFFDDYSSSCFFSRTSPSASDCHLAAASSASGERVGPTGASRRLLDPSSAGEEDYFPVRRRRRASKRNMPEYFTRSFVEMFLKEDEVEEFMKLVDLAGHGKINQPMFKRAVVSIYKMRKALLKSLTSQASICKTVQRMISVVLWVATLVAMLLVFGVNLNTVLVSGAASISALVVALSYIYQNFITAVIFVAFTNPYNVGDRVRIDNGEAMYVRNIHTYTTEFVTIHSKPIVYSNSVLFGRQLTNESRATNATFSMPMRLDIRTQLQSLRFLEAGMRRAIAARPMDFVKDSFSIYITDVQPGRWMDITVWLSAVEGWGNAPKVLRLRTDMYLVLQRLCQRFGISYQEPLLPVQLNATTPTTAPGAAPAISNPQAQQTGAPLHHFHSSTSHGAAAEDFYGAVSNSGSWEQAEGRYRGSPLLHSGTLLQDLQCDPSEFAGSEAPTPLRPSSQDFSGGQLKRRRPNAAQDPSQIRCKKTSATSCNCWYQDEKDGIRGQFKKTSKYPHSLNEFGQVLSSASSAAASSYSPRSTSKDKETETDTETDEGKSQYFLAGDEPWHRCSKGHSCVAFPPGREAVAAGWQPQRMPSYRSRRVDTAVQGNAFPRRRRRGSVLRDDGASSR